MMITVITPRGAEVSGLVSESSPRNPREAPRYPESPGRLGSTEYSRCSLSLSRDVAATRLSGISASSAVAAPRLVSTEYPRPRPRRRRDLSPRLVSAEWE